MTTIAARIHETKIKFAADTQTTSGYRKIGGNEIALSKLHAVNGMLIGSSGIKSHALWLYNFARNHAPLDATEIDVSAFIIEFIEWMRKKDQGFVNQNAFLIAYKGKLFKVFNELSVFEVPEFAAIGSGEDFAIAAMYLGHDAKKAVEVATKLDIYSADAIEEMEHDKESK